MTRSEKKKLLKDFCEFLNMQSPVEHDLWLNFAPTCPDTAEALDYAIDEYLPSDPAERTPEEEMSHYLEQESSVTTTPFPPMSASCAEIMTAGATRFAAEGPTHTGVNRKTLEIPKKEDE